MAERWVRMRETSKRRGTDGWAESKMDGTARAIKKPWFFKKGTIKEEIGER